MPPGNHQVQQSNLFYDLLAPSLHAQQLHQTTTRCYKMHSLIHGTYVAARAQVAIKIDPPQNRTSSTPLSWRDSAGAIVASKPDRGGSWRWPTVVPRGVRRTEKVFSCWRFVTTTGIRDHFFLREVTLKGATVSCRARYMPRTCVTWRVTNECR